MSETEKPKPNKESTSSSTTTTLSPQASSSTKPGVTGSSGSSISAPASPTAVPTTSSTSTGNGTSGGSVTKAPSKPPPLPPPPPPPPKLLPPPPQTSRPRNQEQNSVAAIRKSFSELMKDPECLDKAADYLYDSLLEDAIMGVFFEVHYLVKSGAMEAIEGQPEDEQAFKIVDMPNYDVFGMSTARKAMDCNCPNCDRQVAASRFAPHLEKCMGMGRKTSRVASRRLANAKEGNSSYFSANVSDDEDDADWSSEKRRKKIQSSRTNGSKKNGKSS